MGTHFSVVAVCRDCSDHVSWVDVFESCFETFFFEVENNLCFEEDSDILGYDKVTGSLMFPD